MKHAIWRLAAALTLLVSGTAEARTLQEMREPVPGDALRVIVELDATPRALARDARTMAAADDLLARLRRDLRGGDGRLTAEAERADPIRREYRNAIVGAAIEVPAGAIARLRRLSYVRGVHPDVRVRALQAPSGQDVAPLVDARPRVNAAGLGNGGAGVTVAVIDTGIDYTHPALGGGFGAGFKVAGGYDFVNQDADPIDDNGHGTHVAGTIGGDGGGIIGVAPAATLLAYKVLSAQGSGDMSDSIAAIERALDPNGDGELSDRADVINMSLGGPGTADDAVSIAVDNAVAAGVVVVVAAGNDGRIGSIGSPGTARDAITVAAIDDAGHVTSFSSRGPSARILGFKPDVAAPGLGIVSAFPGGRAVALNGTSMATPHVAGAAALLLNLHPDWTPARLKTALVSSASAITEIPFARGAGRADVQRAHGVKLTADVSGLSFGLRPSRTGVSSSTQIFHLTNVGTLTQSLNVDPAGTPQGVSVTVAPASLTLAPGATAEITVGVSSNDATVAFPPDMSIGGEIRVTGSAALAVPWAYLRAARATVSFDAIPSMILAIDALGGRDPVLFGFGDAEFYLSPDVKYDFLVQGYAIPEGEDEPLDVHLTLLQEQFEVTGDHLLTFRAADAMLELVPDARDEDGVPLASRPLEERSLHLLGLRFFHPDRFSTAMVRKRGNTRLLFSPFSDRWKLLAFEQYVDGSALEAFNIEHPAVAGLASSKTLASGGAELKRAAVAWGNRPGTTRPLEVCPADANTRGGISYVANCFAVDPGEASSFDYYTTGRRSQDAFTGMQFGFGPVMSPALRGDGDGITVSFDAVPSPMAAVIAPGGTFPLGAGPSLPFAPAGTRTGNWFTLPPYGFLGSAGEVVLEDQGTAWQALTADGSVRASGIWRGGSAGDQPPAPVAGGRFVAQRNDLRARGRSSRGTLEVDFGPAGDDLTAPTLTALRVVDASGGITGQLAPGSSAAVVFSIADPDFTRAGETRVSRPEATRVFWRRSGSAEWLPLGVSVTGSESGTIPGLRHFPAGDMYRAELPPAAAEARGSLDLRVEFEDAASNRVRWTQEWAVGVGEELPPKGRAVRH